VNFLLAKWVFWGATVSNFRYFRMSAASDVYCMLMAEFGCGKESPKGNLRGPDVASALVALRTLP
jgi:hypothetical protein